MLSTILRSLKVTLINDVKRNQNMKLGAVLSLSVLSCRGYFWFVMAYID